MGRFIEGCDCHQKLLLSDCVDDDVSAENPTRVIDVFVGELDLAALGFEGAAKTVGLAIIRRRSSSFIYAAT